MVLTKRHLFVGALVLGGLACGVAWQWRDGVKLRAEARERAARVAAQIAGFEQQVATQTERVAAAEAQVAALLKTAKTTPATPAAARVTMDAADAVTAALARARESIAAGKFQAALDEYVTCYREVRAVPPRTTVELERVMSALQSLGRTYPEARAALVTLRDSAQAQWRASNAWSEGAIEIAWLNERLGESQRTIALHDSLPAEHRNRPLLVRIAQAAFVEARRYADVLAGKPPREMMAAIERAPEQWAKLDATLQDRFRQSVVDATLVNIEVLTGAGKTDDAHALTEKLLAFDPSEATRAALQRHLDRARLPQF